MVENPVRYCAREMGKLYHAWEISCPKIPVSTLSRCLSDWMTFIICLVFLILILILVPILILLVFVLLLFSVVRGGVEDWKEEREGVCRWEGSEIRDDMKPQSR